MRQSKQTDWIKGTASSKMVGSNRWIKAGIQKTDPLCSGTSYLLSSRAVLWTTNSGCTVIGTITCSKCGHYFVNKCSNSNEDSGRCFDNLGIDGSCTPCAEDLSQKDV